MLKRRVGPEQLGDLLTRSSTIVEAGGVPDRRRGTLFILNEETSRELPSESSSSGLSKHTYIYMYVYGLSSVAREENWNIRDTAAAVNAKLAVALLKLQASRRRVDV